MIEAIATRKMRAQGIEKPVEVSDEAAKKIDDILQRKLESGKFGRAGKISIEEEQHG